MSENTATTPTDETPAEPDIEGLARGIAELTWDRKGLNTTVIDLRGRVSYTDFLIISTGTSERQVKAIARYVERELRELGWRPLSAEGVEGGRWGLLDFGDVIVHIFNQLARQEFDLEGMWADAPRLELEEPPEDLYGHFAMEQFEP